MGILFKYNTIGLNTYYLIYSLCNHLCPCSRQSILVGGSSKKSSVHCIACDFGKLAHHRNSHRYHRNSRKAAVEGRRMLRNARAGLYSRIAELHGASDSHGVAAGKCIHRQYAGGVQLYRHSPHQTSGFNPSVGGYIRFYCGNSSPPAAAVELPHSQWTKAVPCNVGISQPRRKNKSLPRQELLQRLLKQQSHSMLLWLPLDCDVTSCGFAQLMGFCSANPYICNVCVAKTAAGNSASCSRSKLSRFQSQSCSFYKNPPVKKKIQKTIAFCFKLCYN